MTSTWVRFLHTVYAIDALSALTPHKPPCGVTVRKIALPVCEQDADRILREVTGSGRCRGKDS